MTEPQRPPGAGAFLCERRGRTLMWRKRETVRPTALKVRFR